MVFFLQFVTGKSLQSQAMTLCNYYGYLELSKELRASLEEEIAK